MKKFAAAVLAGGKSSRLGQDKSLLKYRGKTLTALMAGKLLRAGFSPVFVVGPAKAYGLPRAVKRLGEKFQGKGPLSGMEAALRAAKGDCLVTACDFPKISLSQLIRLRRAHKPGRLLSAAKSPRGWEPLLAVYSVKLLSEIRKCLSQGRLALLPLLRRHAKTPALRLKRPLFNVNDPESLERLTKL